jgi:hypothetical protein
MRKIIEKQLKFGQRDIDKICIDIHSRDEIPQLLIGLQAIYCNKSLRENVFKILESIVPDNTSATNGRPGMDLWKILVLGAIRLNCNFDYDKLLELANEHKCIREFLGHSIFDFDQRYALQTLKDNLVMLTPEVLNQINELVVKLGHDLFGKRDKELHGRCDSFVVETNVHFPTDINLLWDAMRKAITLIAREFSRLELTAWRQSEYILRKIKKLFNKANKLIRSNNQADKVLAHLEYIETAAAYIRRIRQDLDILIDMGAARPLFLTEINHFIGHAERQIDQICRRVINHENIPHHEKVFSIFETHTEWISKGKAGVPKELGLRVCILEDQLGFILHHHVMQKQTDDKIAVEMVSSAKGKYPNLTSCSFDKGFHSQKNQKYLSELLDRVILPRKGRLSEEAKAIEDSEDFKKARRSHSAVESAINALENHALDRCPDHGLHGFKRYVSLAVLARNIQILGAKIQQKELRRLNREENNFKKVY